MNKLYDLYGCLLTDKQRSYYTYYYFDDYSLSEIAKIMDVSRNAVHEQIKNVTEILEYNENKLSLLAKKEKRLAILKQINPGLKKEELLDLFREMEKVE